MNNSSNPICITTVDPSGASYIQSDQTKLPPGVITYLGNLGFFQVALQNKIKLNKIIKKIKFIIILL